jgi:hypothetical protein
VETLFLPAGPQIAPLAKKEKKRHYGTLRWGKSSGISATEVKKFGGKQSI